MKEMTNVTSGHDQLREVVRSKYAEIARKQPAADSSSCCGPNSGSGCCAGAEAGVDMIGDAYAGVSGYVAEADLGLGCGVPVGHAGLRPGQTVLDLGSGAGLDAFVARAEVGADGHVIGVDMTAEMIAKARANAQQSGYRNVEFRLGEIEHLPVLSDSVDVVISNCVLNLVPDKRRAFAEIFRVLRPGGHFCVSDIVASQALPEWIQGIADAYAGCVAGAIPREEYLRIIAESGFGEIDVAAERHIHVPAELIAQSLTAAQRAEAERQDLHVLSVTVKAVKPAG
jgi:SAM-dependent methyltransferase